jgi:hypothetical protein
VSKTNKQVVMWSGLGIISPKGLFLEAYGEISEFVLQKYEQSPRGSRLVIVTARLEKVSKKQVRETL